MAEASMALAIESSKSVPGAIESTSMKIRSWPNLSTSRSLSSAAKAAVSSRW
jgi:hypothetical protein